MAVVAIHKLWKDRSGVPIVIEYEEDIPKHFATYKVQAPVGDKGIVTLFDGERAETPLDITNKFGIWHLHFQAPKGKKISIVMAVDRKDRTDHREFGVESQSCIYSGFAVHNDTELLGNRTSLGPFCGKWWSPADYWVKNGKVDWSHVFVTSAQESISLMFYRYFDYNVKSKVVLHVFARTEDCPGQLVSCARHDIIQNKPVSPTEPVVKFKTCKNIYVYLYQTTISECTVTIESSDREFIEVRDMRMSTVKQARRAAVQFHTKPLNVQRHDCQQEVELQSDDESLSHYKFKRFSPRQLVFKSKAKECTISDVYARFFLASTECIIHVFSSMDELGRKVRGYLDVCGSIGLPPNTRETETMKFDIHNPDVEFYTLKWTTVRCIRNTKLKLVVHIHDKSLPQVVTIIPKSTFASKSRNDLMTWKTGSNHVMVTIIISSKPNRRDCPIIFHFSGNKKEIKPSIYWNSSQDACVIKPENLKEKILAAPIKANNMTWRETQKYCQKQGGHLLSIESQLYMENLLFAPLKGSCEKHFEQLYSASMIYIGLHDLIGVS